MVSNSTQLTETLTKILTEKFGFSAFRPYQEEVCRTAAAGQDLLLVMPTGAGKSLCYQLPGIARGGTTLVISPLIALIEDQVAKLRERGLRAERIHSGRDRESSRAVCIEYLNGTLDFLFIAPERLAVPGFLELLAKRKPSLIAVDEAHCISHWGHDFRPEYRMLGQRLPLLRPAPIVALTATATPRVQEDIVNQLGMPNAQRFIRGFRRTNLAIETVELNPGERIEALRRTLSQPSRLPAIVYAPTRKKAEETAEALRSEFRTDAYHAGLKAEERDRIQNAFLRGELDVIVATIAFGMGIDKADVRTVVHLALPASVEGYYQEIGRAGRDGALSRAVMMHAFIDRRTHEFFHERDYPEPALLRKVFEALEAKEVSPEDLQEKSGLGSNVFETCLEKLWVHGGAQIGLDQEVRLGDAKWEASYLSSRNHRQNQLHLITQFAQSQGCRMVELVRYFGDRSDDGQLCGLCDSCQPTGLVTGRNRALTPEEEEAVVKILRALSTMESPSTGKLHRDLFDERVVDRRRFERLLGGLGRAKLVSTYEDSFEKDGKTIAFRRVCLTTDGTTEVRQGLRGLADWVTLPEEPVKRSGRQKKPRSKVPSSISAASLGNASGLGDASISGETRTRLIAALKAWRLSEARSNRVPAFRILSDHVLVGIAEAAPHNEQGLLAVHGFGPKLAEKFGRQIVQVVKQSGC